MADDRMPLDVRNASAVSYQSSGGGTQRGASLRGSANGPYHMDRRGSSSYGHVSYPEQRSPHLPGLTQRPHIHAPVLPAGSTQLSL